MSLVKNFNICTFTLKTQKYMGKCMKHVKYNCVVLFQTLYVMSFTNKIGINEHLIVTKLVLLMLNFLLQTEPQIVKNIMWFFFLFQREGKKYLRYLISSENIGWVLDRNYMNVLGWRGENYCFLTHLSLTQSRCMKFFTGKKVRPNWIYFGLYVDWVILSKRGGKDRIFRGLAGLLREMSRGQSPIEILRNSPASPRKTPSFLTFLLRFTFYF